MQFRERWLPYRKTAPRNLINNIMMKQKYIHVIIVNPSTASAHPSALLHKMDFLLIFHFSFSTFCPYVIALSYSHSGFWHRSTTYFSHSFCIYPQTEWKLIFIIYILVPVLCTRCRKCGGMEAWMGMAWVREKHSHFSNVCAFLSVYQSANLNSGIEDI